MAAPAGGFSMADIDYGLVEERLDEAGYDKNGDKREKGKRPVVEIVPEFPAWVDWLSVWTTPDGTPVRHRVCFGGRSAAKSWTIAAKLLLRAMAGVERVLCVREFQRNIRDSSKRLLDDVISRLGLSKFYTSTDNEIRGINGSLFIFRGLHRNENGIKSLEGITLCWVEEAQVVTQTSIDTLVPTIRVEDSEIWWSYNPRFAKDPVDKMFRGPAGPPPGTVLIPVNFYDNPFNSAVLMRDVEYQEKRDPDKFRHIYLGHYIANSDAKVFKHYGSMRFDVPEDAVLRHGADWGFANDPTVLVQCFIGRFAGEPYNSDPIPDYDGNVLFVSAEVYSIGIPVDELPAFFAGSDLGQIKARWANPRGYRGIPGAKRWKILADSARPEIIAYLKARTFNIEAATKGPGSVEEGVEFLQSYDICVHPDCEHTLDELATYSYEIDKVTEEVLPKLADKNNHVIDALRYALEAVRRAGTGRIEFASDGQRATLAGGDKGLERAKMQEAKALPPSNSSSGGGAGWGSAPGIRGGL